MVSTINVCITKLRTAQTGPKRVQQSYRGCIPPQVFSDCSFSLREECFHSCSGNRRLSEKIRNIISCCSIVMKDIDQAVDTREQNVS